MIYFFADDHYQSFPGRNIFENLPERLKKRITFSENDWAILETGKLPEDYDQSEAIKSAASNLSKELLYMKFVQGIPIIGAVGGFYDAVYIKRINEFANIKYRKRMLLKMKR